MSTSQPSSAGRRKAWAVAAIILSILVGLISAGGIVGSWIIGSTFSSTSVRLLGVVENTAAGVRNIAAGLDQDLRQVQESAADIQAASDQISGNAAGEALALTLLPQGLEVELLERADGLIKTLTTVRNVIAASSELYQTVDSLPMVSLPRPEQETVSELEKGAGEVRSAAQALAAGVTDFRSSTARRIDRVAHLAERLTDRTGEMRARLSRLDADLVALQEGSQRLQRSIPLAYGFASLLLTLFFAYVLYTQGVALRVFVKRLREKAPTEGVEKPIQPEEALSPEAVLQPLPPGAEAPEPEALPEEFLSSGGELEGEGAVPQDRALGDAAQEGAADQSSPEQAADRS